MQLALQRPDLDSSWLDATLTDRVASRIFAEDSTLWGPDAEAESALRLAWTHLPSTSASLVTEIAALRDDVRSRGLTRVVLCGMGGSSLAPEVICASDGVPLTVLDSSHPDMVRATLADHLAESVVVVSSKSGGTVETDSQLRVYVSALSDAGHDPAEHLVIVTDPGSPLDEQATSAGYRVFRADPHVGGRYSALSAFGLVPSGLAGADIDALLNSARSVLSTLAADSQENPALRLGVALGEAYQHGVTKLVLWNANGDGLGDWVEQLVAESTGKSGKGILPVVVPSDEAANFRSSTADSFVVTTGSTEIPEASSGYAAAISGDLGAQFLLWESAVAIAGRIMGINPFDQPDVESAKQAARELLTTEKAPAAAPAVTDDGITAYGTQAPSLTAAVDELLAAVDNQQGYVAVQAYLDRFEHREYADLRDVLAARTRRPVTFGWGPRFLHSTGQLHKGGPPTGVYLQITDDPHHDLEVPGRPFTLGAFIAAQAAGDASVLRSHGRPVLRLHLADAATALPRLRELLA